jgi:hypothetical protein
MADSEMDKLQKYFDSLHSVAKLISDLALSVSIAQGRLDADYMKNLADFAKTFTALTKPTDGSAAVDPAQAGALFRSLAPSHYQFTETVAEVRADLQMASSTELKVGGELGIKAGVFALAVNASYTRRNAFDFQAAALMRTVLHAVPPDVGVLDKLLDAAGKAEAAALPDSGRFKAIAEVFKQLPPPA